MGEANALPQTQNPTSSIPEGVVSSAAAATATATAAAPESKKRKLEDGEFQNSKYFKMRAIVKDLRPLFMEVIRAPDFQKSKAAQDIQKQMKIMLELSKEMWSETASSGKPPKVPEEKPLAGANKEGHMGKHHGGETNASQTQTSQIPSAPDNVTEKVSEFEKMPKIAEKEPLSSRVRNIMSARAPQENITAPKEFGKQLEEGLHRTYVVGGSPIGWNFHLYPGGEAVYYGVTKASALLRRAAK